MSKARIAANAIRDATMVGTFPDGCALVIERYLATYAPGDHAGWLRQTRYEPDGTTESSTSQYTGRNLDALYAQTWKDWEAELAELGAEVTHPARFDHDTRTPQG
ncbi:MAG: hypothetical protein ACJ786_21060 [Catenulispora sp.]